MKKLLAAENGIAGLGTILLIIGIVVVLGMLLYYAYSYALMEGYVHNADEICRAVMLTMKHSLGDNLLKPHQYIFSDFQTISVHGGYTLSQFVAIAYVAPPSYEVFLTPVEKYYY